MINLLFFVAGIALGFFLNRKTHTPEEMNKLRAESKEALAERTKKRKENILTYMNTQKEIRACNMSEPEGVTREEIENLLEVSGQTARKYLDELEDENKITQIGERGPNVHYILK